MTRPSQNPDAKLLRLFREWARNETRYEAYRQPGDDRGFDEIGDEMRRIINRIAKCPPPVTVQGIAALSYIVLHDRHGGPRDGREVEIDLPSTPDDLVSVMERALGAAVIPVVGPMALEAAGGEA